MLVHADLLPMSFSYASENVMYSEVCPTGPWLMILSGVGTILGLDLLTLLPPLEGQGHVLC